MSNKLPSSNPIPKFQFSTRVIAIIISIYLVVILLIFSPRWLNFLSHLFFQSFQAKTSNTEPIADVTETARIDGIPVRIIISRLGIDLAVVNGTYEVNGWNVSATDALY